MAVRMRVVLEFVSVVVREALGVNVFVEGARASTAQKHYLHMRGLLKKSERKAYRDNIPEWYKEGLEEYREEREQ